MSNKTNHIGDANKMIHEMKQTAVDIMFERAISVLPMGFIDAKATLKETYLQAKEMEKEQIRHAWFDSMIDYNEDKTFEEYYQQTYGGNK